MKDLSDEELLQRYRQAGPNDAGKAFVDELFGRHYRKVALWCFRLAGDRDRAADLAQEVLAKAWAHLDHFEGNAKFSTWLYSITRNHCFNKLKSSAWRGEQGTEPETLEAFADLGPNPERAAETSERLALARRLMASELTEVERQVMTLHFAEDMPFEVISRLLRLDNASGAKAYVVSAKRKLRSSVQRWMGRTRGANAHEGGGDGG